MSLGSKWWEGELVPCKWCGQATTAHMLKECANCWEIRTRAEVNPEVARKIIESIVTQPSS